MAASDPVRNPTTTQQRFATFDWLRLFLALEVAVVHAFDLIRGVQNVPSMVRCLALFAAVPGFLSISGYMILQSWRSSATPGEFWIKRATRILPAFLCSFVLVGALFGSHEAGKAFLTWLRFGRFPSVNFPLWSLSCEEMIYGLLALSCIFGLVHRKSIAMATAISTAIFFICRIPYHALTHSDYLALPMCFCWGLLAREYEFRIKFGGVVFTLLALASTTAFYGLGYGFAYPFRILFSCLAILELGRSDYHLPPLRVDYSYGLYIYHAPILAFLIARHYPIWCMAIPICSIVLFSAHAFEQPAMKFRKSLISRLT